MRCAPCVRRPLRPSRSRGRIPSPSRNPTVGRAPDCTLRAVSARRVAATRSSVPHAATRCRAHLLLAPLDRGRARQRHACGERDHRHVGVGRNPSAGRQRHHWVGQHQRDPSGHGPAGRYAARSCGRGEALAIVGPYYYSTIVRIHQIRRSTVAVVRGFIPPGHHTGESPVRPRQSGRTGDSRQEREAPRGTALWAHVHIVVGAALNCSGHS